MRISLPVTLLLLIISASCGVPPPPEPLCPLPIEDGPGFTATLPCNLTLASQDSPVTGIPWFRLFKAEAGTSYALLVIPTSSFQTSVGDPGNFRFVGPLRTAVGDLLIQTETRTAGLVYRNVLGLLANGDMLFAAAGPLSGGLADAILVFNSIDLLGTDGTAIETLARQNSPKLLAPTPDLLAVLDTNEVYRLATDAAADVIDWQSGDAVLLNRNEAFSEIPQGFFLARVGQWTSLPVDFVNQADRLTLSSIDDPVLPGSVQLTLSDGSTWTVDAADNYKLVDWSAGDEVALVRDASLGLGLTHRIVNLKNGDAASTSFAD